MNRAGEQLSLTLPTPPLSAALDDLTPYDVIMVSNSAGKDSMASLDVIAEAAERDGVLDRVTVAHADLGRAEWPETLDLARSQAEVYGLSFEVVRAPGADLLGRVEQRGMWFSPRYRWCTSSFKREPLNKLIGQLVRKLDPRRLTSRPRVLNVMGLRAQESPARAKRPCERINTRATSGRRLVVDALPLHAWSEAQVWDRIDGSRVADLKHPAYDLGMPRLSCRFCIFAPKAALVRSAQLNPELAHEYAALEARIGHSFKRDLSMADVVATAEAGEEVAPEPWIG